MSICKRFSAAWKAFKKPSREYPARYEYEVVTRKEGPYWYRLDLIKVNMNNSEFDIIFTRVVTDRVKAQYLTRLYDVREDLNRMNVGAIE